MRARHLLIVALLLGGCGPTPRADGAQAVVDSVLTPAESLRRLREGLPEPDGLRGGAGDRDALVRGLFTALRTRDTAAVVAMHVSRAEFAWLYYPHAAAAGRMDPGLMWTLLRLESEKGLDRVFGRLGGQDPGYAGYRCEPVPLVEGPNRLWQRCEVELRTPPDGFQARRLFGSILERGGRYKFLSFKTDL